MIFSANVHILNIHLSDECHQVLEAQSGKQALRFLHDSLQDPEHDIDLILLDVMMPLMSGLEVLAHIKKDAQLKNTPIILVTVNADEKSVAEGLDLGPFDYIIKPYSLVILLARVRTALREKERQNLLEKWATFEPLTALFNRRHFFELTLRELDRSNRLNSPLSFIMLDIDNFKQVNDQFAHLVGDLALVMSAKTLKQQLRSVDLCCRYGGEEFVLCLPDTPIEGSKEVAERIRVAISFKLSLQMIPARFQLVLALGWLVTSKAKV
jgi:diguanylate cyclase (GGDEF)-like protein